MGDKTHDMRGLQESVSSLIAQYEGSLTGFIRSRISSLEEAEDILQEVWYQFSKQVNKQPIQNTKAWLFQVARNKIIDSYRKKSMEWLEDYLYESDEEGLFQEVLWEEEDSPEIAYLQDQFWEELYEALDSLPEKQREVFVLNELEGMTLREIAESKSEKLKTIISRKGYAMRHLRDRLQILFEEFVGD